MNIIVTGCNGQLGTSFYRNKLIQNINTYFFYGKNDLDIRDYNKLEKIFQKIKPNILINTAAYTNVGQAEEEVYECNELNVNATKYISYLCVKYNCLMIHFSTDYVFDGKKKSPYNEFDKTYPLSVYGKSKLMGEKQILNSNCSYIILRISWLYNINKKNNLINKKYINLKNNNNFTAVTNQISRPTCSDFLSIYIWKIIEKNINKLFDTKAIFHYSNEGDEISVYDLAMTIKSAYFESTLNSSISPINSDDLADSKIRPRYSILDNSKLNKMYSIENSDWKILLKNNINKYLL